MADIDKGLPNTRTQIDIPSEEECKRSKCSEKKILIKDL